jgi:hypothetical protein
MPTIEGLAGLKQEAEIQKNDFPGPKCLPELATDVGRAHKTIPRGRKTQKAYRDFLELKGSQD